MVFDQRSVKNYNVREVECPERPEGVEGACFVYLLLCCDSSIYCGSTKNLKNRLKEHDSGEAAVWTKKRRPVKLVYYEIHDSLLLARRREKQIKGWTVKKKWNLISGAWGKPRLSPVDNY